MKRFLALGVVVALAGLLFGCASQPTQSTAADASPAPNPQLAVTPAKSKVMIVWGNSLPAEIEYEVIGPVSVVRRWYGGIAQAYPLLADKARELGGNAVLEAHAWLSPAFPVQVAPHGSGIVIRVKDPAKLGKLSAEDGQWE